MTVPHILVIHDTDVATEYMPEQLSSVGAYHEAKWHYVSPETGSFVCYHYFIGTDGSVRQTRGEDERPGCTMNKQINDQSIQVVVAGDFEKEQPTAAELVALRKLIASLDARYHFDQIIPHRDASHTTCPGKYMLEALADVWRGRAPVAPVATDPAVWGISRYYTPIPGQAKYYRPGGYEADFKVNCSGDCFKTADGTDLHEVKAFSIAACPPTMKMGTRLQIEGYGIVTCHDHGGAIKGKRIDIWAGIGDVGLQNIRNTTGGPKKVTFLSPSLP